MFYFLALCTRRNFSANGTPTNTKTTTTAFEENDSETILQTEFDEAEENSNSFRERYRRLIPYMTYYVSNNYVNQQSPYYNSRIIAPGGTTTVQRRPQGYLGGNRISSGLHQPQSNVQLINEKNKILGTTKTKTTTTSKYYVNPPINREKFIPSVQYDPTDMDNEEFFTPVVRYNPNINFDEYQSTLYQRYQTPARFQIQGIKNVEGDFRQRIQAQQQQQHRLLTTIGPLQTTGTFTPGYGDLLVRKPTTPRPTPRPEYNIITTKKPSKPEIVPRPFQLPTSEKSTDLKRRPVQANLNHIVKSLQLTNQLPEILNADNIDESIKTLVEILSILNNGGTIGTSSVSNSQIEPLNPLPKRIETTVRRPTKPIIVQDEGPGPYHVNLIDIGSKYFPAKVESTKLNNYPMSYAESSTTSKPNDFVYGKVTEMPFMELGVATTTENIPSTEEPVAQNYPPPDGAVSHVQNFPPTSLKYGATRGKPNVDYPAYATIPKTEFNCADQRYKGFFGDPDTGCQVSENITFIFFFLFSITRN